jgi:uroporphyrinogen decarboxylase
MDKRERLEKTFTGEASDRAPVALWRAFPGDDQRTADLARCVIDFQRQYDWDFVNIVPAHNYAVIDYGMQDEWHGAADGQRISLKSPIKRSLDWTELRSLDPERGELAKQIECTRQVVNAMGDETPVIVTVYSPLAQASRLAGDQTFIRHLRKNPDRVRTGMNILTESTLLFVEALRSLGVAGICYVIEHADYDIFSESEYDLIGLPYDRKILETLPTGFWFNLVHLRGNSPMLRFVSSYRAQALSWQAQSEESVSQARSLFDGAICGGMDVETHMRQGTPAMIRTAARNMLQYMSSRRLILSAGGAVLTTTPLSNIRAVRETVEGMRV